MLSCLREAFGRIVILPYWLTFSRRPTVLLLNSAFCILNFAFCILNFAFFNTRHVSCISLPFDKDNLSATYITTR